MIQIEEAEKILNSIKPQKSIEKISIKDSLNRVLAQDIISKIDMPPYNKSAMDGYAIFSGDDSERFKVIEIIPAGRVPKKEIKKGECSKIMTGAIVPKGADKIVIKEKTKEKDGFMRVIEDDDLKNICYSGEDIKSGDNLLKCGTKIRASEVGIIASLGIDSINVYKNPDIGILTTGSEIIEPGKELLKGQIYNSNAYSISAQFAQIGINTKFGGVIPDNIEKTRKKISDFFSKVDVLIISGGVSMGDYDYVPGVLEDLGVKLHFTRVAIKPGKPTLFGTMGKKIFFGLPGNPVSTFVISEVIIKPFVYKMMGHKYSPFFIKGIMSEDFRREKTKRASYIPVNYRDGFVDIIEYHGSAHLNSLSKANALLRIPKGVKEILKGTNVNVRQI